MRKRKALLTIAAVLPLFVALLLLVALWAGTLRNYRSQCYVVSEADWTAPVANVVQPTLMLRLTAGDIRVTADGADVYERKMTSSVASGFSGSRTVLVPLPQDTANSKLNVYISFDGKEVNTLVEPPLYGSHDALFHLFMYQSLPALTVGSFQLIFGIVFL
ncbi:MAG: hypothetical protein IJP92_13135, partial [Lachnospiraceae bacterium]|nr:hypothetical protein [Lachnospiraceae bacterium]